jgi:DNA-binding response OmpR family regulator
VNRVLVVEDEEHLAVGLRYNLENAGYEVCLVGTGEAALALLEDTAVDLILLDVMLPGDADGFEIARTIRQNDNFVPIIMLTARDLITDRIEGLNSGADDYVTKPFDLDELLARVRGHLRRRVWHKKESSDEPEATRALEFGECRVDFQTFKARTHDGKEVQLTWKEAMIMRLFAEQEGNVIPRSMFLEKVWNEPGTLETRTVDNFVLRLRKYFEPTPKEPQHILSVRGVGYRFVRGPEAP